MTDNVVVKIPVPDDRSDIGKCLQHILRITKLSTEQVTERIVTPDLRKIRADYQSQPFKVGDSSISLLLEPGAPIIPGGGGVIFRVTNQEVPELKYALKFPRPSLYRGDDSKIEAEALLNTMEYINHAPLAHENIARLIAAPKLTIPSESSSLVEVRPVLMEWVDNALPLTRYLLNNKPDHHTCVDLFIQCFSALDYLHNHNLIHWDLKSDNFLIDSNGTVKLIDIGNARRTDQRDRNYFALTSRHNLPRPLKAMEITDSEGFLTTRRVPIKLPSLDWDCPWLDLWMFTRDINRLLGADPKRDDEDDKTKPEIKSQLEARPEFLRHCFPEDNVESTFTYRILALIVRRLLYRETPTDESYYLNAGAVIYDLKKILPEFGDCQIIPELHAIPQNVLRLPHSGNAAYTPRLGKLLNSKLMVRLGKHLQLGTLHHVYPGGSHRRSEHSAGVVHATSQFVRALYADRTGPFWRLEIEARDVNALLVAAYLHDVGHIAYGHFIEELSGLLRGREHEKYVAYLLDQREESIRRRGILFSDESRKSIDGSREDLRELITLYWAPRGEPAESFMQYVAEILHPVSSRSVRNADDPIMQKASCRAIKTQILHSIINSAIDADKLDYLVRDAHHCGVKYAEGIDIDRFFQSLTTIPNLPLANRVNTTPLGMRVEANEACVGITTKGILPVESILIARYHMFSSVYWHHTARAESTMLQHAVMEYVAVDPRDSDRKLETLIDNFREMSDGEAIRWLRSEIRADAVKYPELKSIVLNRICEAILGERAYLYKTIFELRYKPIETEPVEDVEQPQQAHSVYRALLESAGRFDAVPATIDYIHAVRDLRSDFIAKLIQLLDRKITIEEGELLIDIPPAGKDQIDNIFVVDAGKVKPIQNHSPIAKAVRDTFAFWARKVRVFMSPSALERASKAGITRKRLAEESWNVIQVLIRSSATQRDLFVS